MSEITPTSNRLRTALETSDAALSWARDQARMEALACAVEQRARHLRRRRILLSSLGAIVVAAAVSWPFRPNAAQPTLFIPPSVVVAPAQIEILSDGSKVELGSDARISTAFERGMRRVRLEQGEAHFDVAKDPQRPFIVAAGTLEIRAIGTAFLVDLGETAVQVLVTDGRVALEQPKAERSSAAQRPPPQSLEAGERATVEFRSTTFEASPSRIDRPSQAERATLEAWRAPRLEFSGTRLAEALPLFNRHSAQPIALGEATLADLQLSGAIRASDTESLLLLLLHQFEIRSEIREGRIVLHRSGANSK